jgi:hypothetical protein
MTDYRNNHQKPTTYIENMEQYLSDDEKERTYHVTKGKKVLMKKSANRTHNGRITKLNQPLNRTPNNYQPQRINQIPNRTPSHQSRPIRPQNGYPPQHQPRPMRPQNEYAPQHQPRSMGPQNEYPPNNKMRSVQNIKTQHISQPKNTYQNMQMSNANTQITNNLEDDDDITDENLQKYAHPTTTKCNFYDGCVISLDGVNI